ncbi:hypothetical protein CsSME_00011692 [Camellia sinensis var. sinensis]
MYIDAVSNNDAAGVDNTFRRKFDREEYLERAREREQKVLSKGPPIQRRPLKHRDYEVDLESRLGKTQVDNFVLIYVSLPLVLLLSVWECVVKDSANYLDHINGKKHQRALGMSMRVEQASLEQQQEEEERKRQRREREREEGQKRRQQRRKTEVDADVAAMMGFGDKVAIMVGGEGTRRQQPLKQK